MTDPVLARLQAMGHALPQSCVPRARFRPWRRSGSLLILSGQVCEWNGEMRVAGQVPDTVSPQEARAAAVTCLMNLLFHLRAACGGRLDRVRQWLRLGGFVAVRPGYPDAPLAINAASELLIALYGDAGEHARTAVGVAALPGGAAVEIDAMCEIEIADAR